MYVLVEDGGIYTLKTVTDLQFLRKLGWHITPTKSIALAAKQKTLLFDFVQTVIDATRDTTNF